MKKALALFLICLSFAGCKKNLTGLNTDPKHPSDVPASTLLTAGEKSLADILSTPDYTYNPSNLLAQYWSQTTYTDESNYNFTARVVTDNFWAAMYSRSILTFAPSPEVNVGVMSNLNAAKKTVEKDKTIVSEALRNNQIAMIDLLMVYSWAVLVNTYGDIPYSEALNPDNLRPKYDNATTIYRDLISRIDTDLTGMSSDGESFGSADVIYSGDIGAWTRFANSLKLKLGMMLADVDPSGAKQIVEEAFAAGIFTSNVDNAMLHYQSTTPNTSQTYVQLVLTGRKDFVGSNTMVDIMNSLDDPRIGIYFTDSSEAGAGNYVGGPYGENNTYSLYSHIGLALLEPQFPCTFLDYAEMEFLLAEAAERGLSVSGTAIEHYNNAVRASIESWGISTTDAEAYLSQPEVAYSTAPGNWREKIGTQKWIALYNRGFDGWTEWRRLDYPVLNPPPGMTQSDIPVRFTYPIEEQNLNGANYRAASAHIGGDRKSTKLFWDVH